MNNAPTKLSSKPSTEQRDVHKGRVAADDNNRDEDTSVNEWKRINDLLQDTVSYNSIRM